MQQPAFTGKQVRLKADNLLCYAGDAAPDSVKLLLAEAATLALVEQVGIGIKQDASGPADQP
ncbi:hypothetical protein D3C86_2139610 [compost metagenome]